METEILNAYDEFGNLIGKKSRREVHTKGYWHETFQCWIVRKEKETDYIYFQIRSDKKADFPGLLDITAAGHILADETMEDGIREVHEELGIEVSMNELIPLGVIKNTIITDNFLDCEFGNNFLYISNQNLEFRLQVEEVSGIVKAKLKDFYQFCFGEIEEILVITETESSRYISKKDFVPHEDIYFKTVAERIAAHI